MNYPQYTHEQLLIFANFITKDIEQINKCRRQHNRLGFGYQLAFIRIVNRFPSQYPFEIMDDILTFTSVQLGIPSDAINLYSNRRQTIDGHRKRIQEHLGLKSFDDDILPIVQTFIFEEACRLEQSNALLSKTYLFLKDQKILSPSIDKLKRLIGNQREEANNYIFGKISKSLSEEILTGLNALVDTTQKRYSDLHVLKQPPGRPSPQSMLMLTNKIDQIQGTGILDIDLTWLNNNYQRSLTQYAKRCNANRLRELEDNHRFAVLVCFLWQIYKDTIDQLIDMYSKLINKIYNHAQNDVDKHDKTQRKKVKESLANYKTLLGLLFDDSIAEPGFRDAVFEKIGREYLASQIEDVNIWLTGKHSHVFNLVKVRFSYIRQFLPYFLEYVQLQPEGRYETSIFEAVDILREMNDNNKRKLPEDIPTDFIPKKILQLVEFDGEINKPAWECALLTAIRDEIKSGNISVKMSKRFGHFDEFFVPKKKWIANREKFFQRAGLPSGSGEVENYLTKRLNLAYDQFLEQLPHNTYAEINENGWNLSTDSADKLDVESENKLNRLKSWLSSNMRIIKLPELLIEVDNDLKITRNFMAASQLDKPSIDNICAIIATVMAHGCNIGTYTMSHLIEGVSYSKIKHITDWMLTEESLRTALALVVNAISNLNITKTWGEGKTSSSDGQRFTMRRKVLQQTYSAKFNDFALEFYSFVADNFAPFFSFPIECTDRDAPYVLDGLLYNESDLPLDEDHYVDTHGFTENNFAGFAMLGRNFSPRIKGLKKQRIYKIDKDKDYQSLTPLISRSDRIIHTNWICDQWDCMGHFYFSLECGHTTASTAMKRLNGFSGKNHFYRANRELGRIFKTEHILKYMSDKTLRQRTTRGLLKGEQIHALARDLNYGKGGRISKKDLHEQRMSCSCMTLILACIIYWQAKEINSVVLECDPEGNGIDLKLMEHVSPITWDNVILYGEYVLNRNLIKL